MKIEIYNKFFGNIAKTHKDSRHKVNVDENTIHTLEYNPPRDRIERMKESAPEMYGLLRECATELDAIGSLLSNECWDLIARIDGKVKRP